MTSEVEERPRVVIALYGGLGVNGLIEKFEAGERSGTKADPLSVSREMKFKRDDKGELVFQPEEWKTAKTIKSFFSRRASS